MGSPAELWWGAPWCVPGWEQPAPASDLAAWLGASDAPYVTADVLDTAPVDEALAALASSRADALRVPLDWARLEPVNGRLDGDAVDHLRAALAMARDRGFAVWGVLVAGSLPGWFAHDERGFGDERTRRYLWARHVETVGELVGDLVHGWIPVLEPTRWAKRAWLDGDRPPGRVDDGGGFARNLEGIHLATVEAALRLGEGGQPVASDQWLVPVFPARDDPRLPPSAEAEVAAGEVDEVVRRSWLRLLTEDTLVVPGRAPVEVPGAREAFGLIGFTYHHAVAVGADRSWGPYPQALATGPDGHVPWSEGLALTLHRLAESLPDRDLLVVDTPTALAEPEARSRYLSEIRDIVTDAAAGGIPVVGCFTPE